MIRNAAKCLASLALLCACATAGAADYPARPVRIVVPSTPGGGLDVLARLLQPRLAERWGQPVVIDNRPGAGGVIGSEIAARAAPDGHTLLLVATGYSANPFLYPRLPYDTPKDFAAITIVGHAPNVLAANPQVPARTLGELLALARRDPGKLNFASSGVGTGGHLSMALLMRSAGIRMVHLPYKGAGAAVGAVVSGEAQMLFTVTGAVLPHVRAGRLRALAVTSAERWPTMPAVPTVAESGVPGYEVNGWYAMLAPGKTPRAVVDRIYRDVAAVIATPEVAKRIEAVGFRPGGMAPDDLSRYIDAELAKWGAVIREAGIKAN